MGYSKSIRWKIHYVRLLFWTMQTMTFTERFKTSSKRILKPEGVWANVKPYAERSIMPDYIILNYANNDIHWKIQDSI